MRTLAAYINGQPVDYLKGGDFPIAISRDVSEAQDLTKRGGDATLSFKLPATANNRQIFGDLYIPEGVNQFYVAAPYRFTLIVDGETVLNNAALTVRKANEDSIECYAIATNINWANLLAAKNLRQIQSLRPFVLTNGDEITACNAAVDTSDPNRYDHPDEFDVVFPLTAYGQFFVPNIWGAQNKISQQKYVGGNTGISADGIVTLTNGREIYGLTTYSLGPPPFLSGNAHLTIQDWMPCIYLTAIIRAIFADIGYRLVSTFLFSIEFRKLVLLYVNERPPILNWATQSKFAANSDGSIKDTIIAGPPDNESVAVFIQGGEDIWLFNLFNNKSILPLNVTENGPFRYDSNPANPLFDSYYLTPTAGQYKITVVMDAESIGTYDQYWLAVVNPPGATITERYQNIITAFTPPTLEFDPERVTVIGTQPNDPLALPFHFEETITIDVPAGYVITIIYVNAFVIGPYQPISNLTNLEIAIDYVGTGTPGPDVDLAAQLPNMTQLDFIKRMTSAFDLYYDIDDENGIAYVDTRNNFYDSYQNAIDLTDYLRRSSGDVYPNPQAKTYRFQHLEDSNDFLVQNRGGFLRYSHTETNPVRDGVGDKIINAGFAPTEYDQFALVDDTADTFNNPNFVAKAVLNLPFLTTQERYASPQNDLIQTDSDFDFDLRIVKIKSNTTLPSGAFLPYRVNDPVLGDVYRQIDFYIETVFDDIPNPVTNPIPTPAPQLWSLTYEKNKYGLFRLYLPQILELEKGFQADYDVVLTPQLFRQLSLRRIVKIGGAIFRLVKIEQFKPGSTSPTKIVLSRIT